MINRTRFLLAALLALWVSLPGVSEDGGENGTGIWILPRAGFVMAPAAPTAQAVESRTFPINKEVVMRVSDDMGVPVATFIDSVSALPVALPVTGNQVGVPAALMQAVAAIAGATAEVLVVDSTQLGYLLRIVIDRQAGTATISVL